jgi:hypothetical protein
MEIEAIQFDLHTQYHMLRHFEQVDEQLCKDLERLGYSLETINIELTAPGSRFNQAFAYNIETLLSQMKLYGFKESKGLNGNVILVCIVSPIDFADGIGSKAVVAKKELSVEQQASIFLKENRNTQLAHLQVESFPKTNTFCVILKKKGTAYQFITAFPGEPAMPLPDEKMDGYLFNKCRAFWDEHVFFVKNEL